MLLVRRLSIFLLSLILVVLGATVTRADSVIVPETCAYQGIPLYGNVQVVDSFPDIKVQQVSSFPDLKVQVVDTFPDRCGLWHYTNSFPDFKVQFVKSFPDIKIQFVQSFPGIP
ncbi:MAG: hypothetical protein KME16_07500 [Scytolyngbya sp. HA4215-MV1]|jgi:hypothetical protein|nr:hypothetical protein [Scytolyngbya sp. HA4215-MV1]